MHDRFERILRQGTIYLLRLRGRGEGVLKFVKCLWILLLLNNRSIVHFCGCLGWRGSQNC